MCIQDFISNCYTVSLGMSLTANKVCVHAYLLTVEV